MKPGLYIILPYSNDFKGEQPGYVYGMYRYAGTLFTIGINISGIPRVYPIQTSIGIIRFDLFGYGWNMNWTRMIGEVKTYKP